MTGKSVFIVAFLVAIVAIVANAVPKNYPSYEANRYAPNNGSHDLIVGAHLPNDRLVLRQNVVKASSWMQVVTVERTFNVSRYERITMLKALDQKTNGNGANVSLRQGGPGMNNVTLVFRSLKGHGINFIVEIYARR